MMPSLAANSRPATPASPTRWLAVLSCSVLIAACGILPEQKDETAGWSANKLYSEAKESMSDGGWDKAIKLFEKLEARYPYGRFAQQAQMEIAYAYWKSGEPASALAACDRFIKLHPNHPNVDYMYYLKGLISFNEDQGLLGYLSDQDQSERDPKAAKEAFAAFKELVTRFPASKYTPDAALRMNYLVNALVSGEVHVARYYMVRGAYLAAANRAQEAIRSYPTVPASEEGLIILAQAYEKLALPELRADAERVLKANFPQSRYLGGPGSAELPKKPWWKPW